MSLTKNLNGIPNLHLNGTYKRKRCITGYVQRADRIENYVTELILSIK